MFSATMPPEIKRLADKFLSNAKTVSVAPPASPALTVQQHLVWTTDRAKQATLAKLIKQEDVKNAFIFCNRKKDIGGLAKFLERERYAAAPLHGDMTQPARTATLQRFKDGEITLLVCSDVAARGLDIQGVSHVFNFDVPWSPDDYVHRIGRTGRAGMSGRAWTLASDDDKKFIEAIEKLIKKAIPVETVAASSNRADRPERAERAPREDRPRAPRPRPVREDRPPPSRAPRHESDDNLPSTFSDDDIPAFLKR